MPDSQLAFVGTTTGADEDGVFGFRVDGEGKLHRTYAAKGGTRPMFLTPDPDGDHLYVACRPEGDGHIVAYSVNQDMGTLSRLNEAPTLGRGTPCYCSIDATDQCVFTAQYGGGSVSVLPVDDDGHVGEPTDIVEHEGSGPGENRQTEPHPHAILPGPDNKYVYTPDIGADRVFIYAFDPELGMLEPADCGHVDLHAGAGPRHLVFHPNGRYAYAINELDSTVTAFERNVKTGALESFATVTTLPDEFESENYPADLHIHPSGEYLYGSNRGHDSIAIYEIDVNGRPSLIETESTRGDRPRDFAIDPTGTFLFAENVNSDTIVTFRIENDGTLAMSGHVTEVPSPACLRFINDNILF